MKILIGMPSPDSWGGPIASEPPFVEALKALGHDVVTEVYVYGDKAKPTPLFSRACRVLKTALRFRKVTSENDFDLIHLNTAFDRKTILRDSFSLFCIASRGTKIFLKLHGSFAEEFVGSGWVMRKLIRYLQKHVDGYGYHTYEELESFKKLGFDEKRFFRVKNAVNIHLPKPKGLTRREKSRDEVFELLFVSRLIPTKGVVETIEACSKLRQRGIKFRLTCVGDGPSRREAEDAVGRLGLGRVVKFTGHIPEDEVTRFFFTSDIFVFPTIHGEGFPNVLFKAVAAGMPIVTTRIRAAADYLAEPQNCLFCEKDPHSIADRLEELINDRQLRKEMSKENLCFGNTLTPGIIASEFVETYTKVIIGRSQSGK